jgi:hypothetical protein
LISYFDKTCHIFATLKKKTVQHQHSHNGALVKKVLYKNINVFVVGFKAFVAGVAQVVVFLSQDTF